ncbi:toxin-antitoxin system TumE family protein [Desulfonema magnum]|uniref:Uncharacterized protein n=1 Tax=Desulfonema magnum TaxID=45655 RepID=A0A975GTS6_9BACT|nr:DUF6516 family protein [Desulfonema magnum]QTA93297.1 Uncharacterized protein dnm_093980 [Desulfonema magnum]
MRLIRHDVLETDKEEILIYRIRINLSDGGLLEMRERIVESEGQRESTTYSFHWQNRDGSLVKRWDNVPHHPELDNFPYHVHIDDEANVVSGKPADALDMLTEIDECFRQH